jgi:FkbM family methyltransferase
MTSTYFLFSKNANKQSDDNSENQIVYLNPGSRHVFLLPETDLDHYWQKGLFECQLIEWAKQFCIGGKTFVDIGARTGTYSISLSKHCGNVVAFEPEKSAYYALCGSVAASGLSDKITCHQCALGNDDQVKAQKNESEDPIMDNWTDAVCVRTFDSFHFKNVGFIKMFVANNGHNVLRGALNTLYLSNYPTILFESSVANPELFGILREALKYKIVNVGGVNNMYLACKE